MSVPILPGKAADGRPGANNTVEMYPRRGDRGRGMKAFRINIGIYRKFKEKRRTIKKGTKHTHKKGIFLKSSILEKRLR